MPAMLASLGPAAGSGKRALPAPGDHAGGDVDTVPVKDKKPKAPPSLQKKAASKVSSLSSKLTDLKCLRTQVAGSDL